MTLITPQNLPESDPRHHTDKIKQMLRDVANHMRDDVQKVDEPKAKALFETSAEVLEGLITAFTHYEQQSEEAWRS